MSEVVMRPPTPRANDSIRKFMDLFLARIVEAFEGSSEEELVSMNPPKEKKPETHQQRLLREMENERQENDFLTQILMEKEFDEDTI